MRLMVFLRTSARVTSSSPRYTFPHYCADRPVAVRNTLWEDVGVVRKPSGLQAGADVLSDLAHTSIGLYITSELSPATVDLRNGGYS